MTKRELKEAISRLVCFWQLEVGELPTLAPSQFGNYLKQGGLTEDELQQAITAAAARAELKDAEDVLVAIRESTAELRRLRQESGRAGDGRPIPVNQRARAA